MPEKQLHVEMVTHTVDPQALTALGARLCYAGGDIAKLLNKVTTSDQTAFIEKLMSMGHESVLEHVSFTFICEGVSRVLLAQLTRHRLASYSVQSQRYVSYKSGFGYIVPPSVKALGEAAVEKYTAQMAQMQSWYEEWQSLLGSGEKSNEDARFVLPNACETRILLTMNVRELRHFFSMRMCNRAQWEIRELANQMFRYCYNTAPALFRDAGPGCLRGACPEGEKSCGKAAAIRAERKALLQTAHAAENAGQPD